jgi:hypothetical protein
MIRPKQGLHSFTRLYQAREAAPAERLAVFGAFAASLAEAKVIGENDASTLQNIQAVYSISTIEELAAIARIDDQHKTSLLKNLGLSPDIVKRISVAIGQAPQGKAMLDDLERYEKMQYSLGCHMDFTIPPKRKNLLKPVSVAGITFGAAALPASGGGAIAGGPAAPGGAGALPPAGPPPAPSAVVSLIDALMPPIRDQADRGTCVSFTSVACLEYHQARFNGQPGLDLSEQYEFYNMITKTGQQNLVSGFPLLTSSGTCREQTWPYYPKPIPPNDAQGPPPSVAAAEAAAYACRTVRQLSDPRSVQDIQQEIGAGRIVGVGIPVYNSWYYNGIVRQYGNINVPIPGEVPLQIGHAFCLVGFADDPDFAGGGYFIVRNSWSSYWATLGVYGAGYGTIPYKYINDFNWDAWCVIS